MNLKEVIVDVPDFPTPGVLFRDISPLLRSPVHFNFVIEAMVKDVDLSQVDHIVGIESRGFILGAAMAAKYQKGFVPLRKAGKLPPPVEALAYTLEYGQAVLEMKPGSGRVLIVDDVLATGGTLKAAMALCERSGFHVEDIAVLINLTFLNEMKWKSRRIPSVLEYSR